MTLAKKRRKLKNWNRKQRSLVFGMIIKKRDVEIGVVADYVKIMNQ